MAKKRHVTLLHSKKFTFPLFFALSVYIQGKELSTQKKNSDSFLIKNLILQSSHHFKSELWETYHMGVTDYSCKVFQIDCSAKSFGVTIRRMKTAADDNPTMNHCHWQEPPDVSPKKHSWSIYFLGPRISKMLFYGLIGFCFLS